MPPYNSLNLGTRCGDNLGHTEENRKRLFATGNLPSKPIWLEQVRGEDILRLVSEPYTCKRADASYSNTPSTVYAMMTADCLPVLPCNRAGAGVATIHAGRRGLCAGVLEETAACFANKPENIIAWLDLAIGPNTFEVGPEVCKAFTTKDPQADLAFVLRGGRYLADICQLARQRLSSVGVESIHGSNRCAFSESETFFLYRHDNTTSRMANFIWLV